MAQPSSDAWYFLAMNPEEAGETYNSDEESVEFEVVLRKLSEDPVSWFQRLWSEVLEKQINEC